MKNQKDTAVAKTAWTLPLDTPITYPYSWTEYESFEELQAAKDELTNDEQVKVRNVERKNNARQKAYAVAMTEAGIVKPTAENNEQVRLKDMFKVLMTSKKYTEEQARELASTTLGIEWAE
jgi:hypothetical protein